MIPVRHAGRHSNRPTSPDAQPRQANMSKLTDVIDRYIATWNETDAEQRRALIVRTWTETASYLDPVLQGESQAGIDAMIQGVQARFPGHQFPRADGGRRPPRRGRLHREPPAGRGPGLGPGPHFRVPAGGRPPAALPRFFDHAPAPWSAP